jgi:hypothetical protein
MVSSIVSGQDITLWDSKEDSIGQMSDEIHGRLGGPLGTTKGDVIGAETTGTGGSIGTTTINFLAAGRHTVQSCTGI